VPQRCEPVALGLKCSPVKRRNSARELRIGRPDLPREYDHGGLVDVDHVPGEILTSRLGLAPGETAAIVVAREERPG
jgi:hypothetical protein